MPPYFVFCGDGTSPRPTKDLQTELKRVLDEDAVRQRQSARLNCTNKSRKSLKNNYFKDLEFSFLHPIAVVYSRCLELFSKHGSELR